jgi:hypothetical protein
MERRYRPRSYKQRCNCARQRACGCRGNQRSVIEAAIAQSCGVGRDWHQHRLSPELALHDANGGLQPSAEWFCKRRYTVELQ